jgi:hypothetical protein
MTGRTSIPKAFVAGFIGVMVVLAVVGCRQRTEGPERRERPVEPALVAFLSHARAAHHRADLFEDGLDLVKALDELAKVTSSPMAQRSAEFAEIREALADTRARMADLESRLGRPDEADREVARGLELVPEATYFRGHLLEVRGLLEERRAQALGARARELLAQADTRLRPGSPEARRRDDLVRKLGPTPDAGAPRPDQVAEQSLRATERELDDLRRGALTNDEQRSLDGLRAGETAARQRALDAFEQSMTVQAEVIRSRTQVGPDR